MSLRADPLTELFKREIARLADAGEEEMKAAAMRSPAIHFALFCRLADDNGDIICPVPNILQLRMNEAYEVMRELGVRVRIIVTKPRRAGCSSFVEHIGYHSAMVRPIEGITISDNKEHSAEAMAKLQRYAEFDSFPWGIRQIQDAEHSVAWSNGSKWTVDTAMNPDAGAGGTRQFGHFSETSKWPQTTNHNDEKTMTCVMPSLSGMSTTVFSESTPEGARGWQYRTWTEDSMTLDQFLARWHEGFRPEEVWIRVFAAWFEFESNRRRFKVSAREIQHFRETLTDQEREEIERYQLDWEQVGWRRDTIKSKCGGDPKVFSYYYPSDPLSCWLTSGAPRFDMAALVQWEEIARGVRPDTGYLVSQIDKQVTFHRQTDGTGDVLIYEPPIIGCKYGVVADPSESLSQTVGANPDANSICVWRAGYHDSAHNIWRPMKLAARIRPPYQAEEDDVAAHIVRLSSYYGRAIVALEVNKGFHVLRCLQAAGVPLFKRSPMSARDGKQVQQYGFKMTDKDTREAMISSLASAITNGDIEVKCPHMISEMKSFIRNPKGKSEASSSKHDDDVINASIAWEIVPTSATEYRVHKVRNVEPRDEGRNGWRQVSALKR